MVRQHFGLVRTGLGGMMGALIVLASPCHAQVRDAVVKYPSGDQAISLECFIPKGRGKLPAVVLLHGSGGLEQATGPLFRQAAGSIARRGYVVVIPHYFEKTNHQPGAPLANGEYEAMMDAVKDAVTYTAAQPEVDATRLAMIGLSMGSNLAMITAVRDPRIKALACWSGAYPPVKPSKKLPPLLILHGSEDDSTPLRYVQLYQKALTEQAMPHDVHIYQGTGHNFNSNQLRDATARTGLFLDKFVKASRDAPANSTPPGDPPKAARSVSP